MHLIKPSSKNICIQIIFPLDVKIIKQLSLFLASLLHEALGKGIALCWCV